MLANFLEPEFARWGAERVIYRNKADPDIRIEQQSVQREIVENPHQKRIVKLSPWMHFLYRIELVDTALLDKTAWTHVED